jgi:hypothetical protein
VVGVTLDELSRGIGAVGGKRGTVENGDTERWVGREEREGGGRRERMGGRVVCVCVLRVL